VVDTSLIKSKMDYTTLQKEVESATNNISELKKQLGLMTTKGDPLAATLTPVLQDRQKDKLEIDKKLAETGAKLKAELAQADQLKKKLKLNEEKLAELTKQRALNEQQLVKTKAKFDSGSQEKSRLEAELKQLNDAITVNDNINKKLQDDINNLRNRYNRVVKSELNTSEKISAARTKTVNQSMEIKKLQDTIETINKEKARRALEEEEAKKLKEMRQANLPNGQYLGACISPNGKYMVVSGNQGGFLSSDNGANWKKIRDGDQTNSIVIRDDGTILLTKDNNRGNFISKDFGDSWKPAFNCTYPRTPGASKDGSRWYVTAGESGGGLYFVSTDGGNTFNTKGGNPSGAQNNIDCSDDGMIAYCACYALDRNPGYIWKTTDGGNSWAKSFDRFSGLWQRVYCSGDGQVALAAHAEGALYLTTDSGATWNDVRPQGTSTSIAIAVSKTSRTLVFTTQNTNDIYISKDLGKTFTKIITPLKDIDWSHIYIAADGSKIIGTSYSKGVFVAAPAAPAAPGGGTIQIIEATYGGNCNSGLKGNRTDLFTKLANGKTTFDYTYDYTQTGGDPAGGCGKTLVVKYSCGNETKEFSAPPEAGVGAKVALVCGGGTTGMDIRKLPGIKAWFDASDPLNNKSVPENGAQITKWVDKSGNESDALSTGKTPLATNSLNGRSGISISGGNYFKCKIPPSTFLKGLNAFVVYKSTGQFNGPGQVFTRGLTSKPNLGNPVDIAHNPNAAFANNEMYLGENNGVFFQIPPSSKYKFNNPNPSIFNLNINQNTKASSKATLYSTGNPVELVLSRGGSSTWEPSDTGDTFCIGGRIDYGSTEGIFYEVIVYNSILTDSERQSVEGALAWKWGIQGDLPATHPFKSSAPT